MARGGYRGGGRKPLVGGEPMTTYSFQLDSAARARLDKLAADAGVSPSEAVRRLVRAADAIPQPAPVPEPAG